MVVQLAHVCIETAKLEDSEAFYKLLGITRQFEFRNEDDELVGMYLTIGGNSFLELVKVREPRVDGTLKHFALEVDDVDATYASLLANGIAVTDKEYAGDHTLMITCHDPNGVYIELQQYTDRSMQFVGGVCKVEYQP